MNEDIERKTLKLCIDYLGSFLCKMFLVIVDSSSKWVEVFLVPNLTSQTTINSLRTCFATHVLPQICVSDNGSYLTCKEFEGFMKKNDNLNIRSAPYCQLQMDA